MLEINQKIDSPSLGQPGNDGFVDEEEGIVGQSLEHVLRAEIKYNYTNSFQEKKQFEEYYLNKFGKDGIELIVAYGSLLHGGDKDKSMWDFFVLVDDYDLFHESQRDYYKEINGLLTRNPWVHKIENMLLPPNIYQDLVGKYNVVELDQFEKETSEKASDLYFIGRCNKVMKVVYSRSTESLERFADCVFNSMMIAGEHTLNLLGMGGLEEFNKESFVETLLGLSYRADRRLEAKGKVKELYLSRKEEYDSLYERVLGIFAERGLIAEISEGVYTDLRLKNLKKEFKKTDRIIRKTKRKALFRMPKNILTNEKWAEYALAKLEKSDNIDVPYDEKHKFLSLFKFLIRYPLHKRGVWKYPKKQKDL